MFWSWKETTRSGRPAALPTRDGSMHRVPCHPETCLPGGLFALLKGSSQAWGADTATTNDQRPPLSSTDQPEPPRSVPQGSLFFQKRYQGESVPPTPRLRSRPTSMPPNGCVSHHLLNSQTHSIYLSWAKQWFVLKDSINQEMLGSLKVHRKRKNDAGLVRAWLHCWRFSSQTGKG